MADGSDLIAAIYDAIIDPSGWDDVTSQTSYERRKERLDGNNPI
jgi:hypothetical protein